MRRTAPTPVRLLNPTEHAKRVVLVGVGGTGGYVVQQLCRLVYGLKKQGHPAPEIVLADGDAVEEKNLLRQYFLPVDLGRNKADALAERYGRAYGINVAAYPAYIDTGTTLRTVYGRWRGEVSEQGLLEDGDVLVGCVDNAATRAIMHREAQRFEHLVYIDAGNAAVAMPEGEEEINRYDLAALKDSGYAGQVVAGARFAGRTVIPLPGEVFPNLIEVDEGNPEDLVPNDERCADAAASNPQRHLTNLQCATIVVGYLTTLLSDGTLLNHRTFFDARAGWVRSDAAMQAMLEVSP